MPKPKRKPVSEAAGAAAPAGVVPIDGERWETLAEMRKKKREWLWPGLVPAHTLTLISGSKGVGKSTLLSALVAAVAGETKLPGVARRRSPQGTLYLVREESYETDVLPRLIALGVDPACVVREKRDPVTGVFRPLHLSLELDTVTDLVKRRNIGLVVCDPNGGLIPPADPRARGASVRPVLEKLIGWCQQTHVTLVATQHLRKGRNGTPLEGGLGELEWANVARSILRCSEHPTTPKLYVLSRLAGNNGNRREALQYEIEIENEVPRIVWAGDTTVSIEEIMEGLDDPALADEKKDATTLLKEIIGDGWVRVREIQREGEDAMISLRTLKDRKKRLNIPSRRVQRDGTMCWEWGPPPEGWPAAEE